MGPARNAPHQERDWELRMSAALHRDGLDALTQAINRCRAQGGCGSPHCGVHAVGKPTCQVVDQSRILVVGEAPATGGWWMTGRAFHRWTPGGTLELSRTGANLNECLAALNAKVETVGFVEAVRCRPSGTAAWRPGERARRKCLPFLVEHLRLTQPRLVLPIGQIAVASCLEVAFGAQTARLEDVVGEVKVWHSSWGQTWIVPLYHPSPANYGRWPKNKAFLTNFAAKYLQAVQTDVR